MPTWLLVALGSALGGVARWALVLAVDRRAGGDLPWGTLAVNVLGGALAGVCFACLTRNSANWALLVVGVLGGFTTFSAYSLQTFDLLQQGRIGWAAAYAFGSVAACLLACWGGWALARQISPA